MNRRKFLKTLGVGSAGLAVAPGMMKAGEQAVSRGKTRKPKNLIFMVSDGMSQGTLALADQYLRWQGKEGAAWIRLMGEPQVRRSLMDMSSLNSIVTDSAAAASSWGGGQRVNNGSLNVGPGGEEHLPLWIKAKQVGKKAGLVTTATATHATPAGFAANSSARGDEQEIARQYLERDIDVVLGGGLNFFHAEKRKDQVDMVSAFREQGRTVVYNRAELQQAPVRGKLLGLFSDSHVPYDLQRLNQEALLKEIPSLREMTVAALQQLETGQEGFVLLVEGARVDHAAHGNDFSALIYDQLAFDEAVAAAKTYCENHEDTLLVVTTDHGNANPGLSNGRDMGDIPFRFLQRSKGTYGDILNGFDEEQDVAAWEARIHEFLGVTLVDREKQILGDYLHKKNVVPYARYQTPFNFLGQLLANHSQVGWVGNTHTSDYVELLMYGPGSEMLPNFIRNDQVHHYLVARLGLERS